MKKRTFLSVLSLLLAITMLFGMGTVGFTASAEADASTYLNKTVYEEGEDIEVLWDVLPATVGWVAIYRDGITDNTKYGDYVQRNEADVTLPTNANRWKSDPDFVWPIKAGTYTVKFFQGSGYTVLAETVIQVAAKVENTITITPDSVPLGEDIPMNLVVSGGLEANKTYTLRLYPAYNGTTGFGSGDINFSAGAKNEQSVTTDENGGLNVSLTAHVSKISATGKYAYVIMDGWDTKARAFFDVTEAVSVIHTVTGDVDSVVIGAETPITITVTGGLDASKEYGVRLFKAWGGDSGFGTSGVDWSGFIGAADSITTDENGAATFTVNLHNEKVTETGKYAYCILDGDDTKARVFFSVTGAPSISADVSDVLLGEEKDITVTIENALDANTWYRIRIYKAHSGYESGLGSSGVDWSGLIGELEQGFTTDANGSYTLTLSAHTDKITETGTYAYCIMTASYDTKARIFFNVTTADYLDKSVYAVGEKISVQWANIPSEIGWAGIYTKDETNTGNYGDYVERTDAAFPSGQAVRYKAFTWPAAAGEYKVIFFKGSGYEVAYELDITIKEYKVSLTPDTVKLGENQNMTLCVEGGLVANKSYKLRLYPANNDGVSGMGSNGVNFGGGLKNEQTVTTDANGALNIEVSAHITKLTASGRYAYCIMDGWDTKARAFFMVEEPYSKGDLTLDGQVNVLDLVRAKKLLAEVIDDYTNSDVNGDGDFDALDVAELRKLLIG